MLILSVATQYLATYFYVEVKNRYLGNINRLIFLYHLGRKDGDPQSKVEAK